MATQTVQIKDMYDNVVDNDTIDFAVLAGDFEKFQTSFGTKVQAVSRVLHGGDYGGLFLNLARVLVGDKVCVYDLDSNKGHQKIFDLIMDTVTENRDLISSDTFKIVAHIAASRDNITIVKRILDLTGAAFDTFFQIGHADDFARDGLVASVKMIYDNHRNIISDDYYFVLSEYAKANHWEQLKEFVAYMVGKGIVDKEGGEQLVLKYKVPQ
jgi:hypothetical protein